MKTKFTVLALFLLSVTVHAQKMDREHLNVEAYVRESHLLDALGIYDRLILGHDCAGAGVTVGVNTFPSDDNYWAWAYNFPQYGLGFSYSAMSSIACRPGGQLGDAWTAYGFARVNLVRTRFFSMGPKLEFGASYLTRHWDPESNPLNTYAGTPVLVMIGLGLEAGFHITPRWELGVNALLTHRSNGMLKTPNHGLNELGSSVYLRYHFSDKYLGARGSRPEIPEYRKWIYDLYFSGGVHSCDAERHVYDKIVEENGEQNRWNEQKPWLRLNLGFCVSYRYHPVFSSGIGLDLSYTANWKRLAEYSEIRYGQPAATCPVYLGAYVQQSFYYKNVEIGIGLGVYLFKRLAIEDSKWNYQRALIRYHIPKAGDIFFGFAMRAHSFDRSDTLEFSFGKRF